MMRSPVAVLVAAVLITCHVSAQQPSPGGAFVIAQRGDTLVIDRFHQSGDTMQGSISVKGQPRQDYVAVLSPDLTVRQLTINVYAVSARPDAAPLQHITVTLRNDSAIADVGGRIERFATRPQATVLMNNAFSLAESFTRRARRDGGSGVYQGWALSGGVTLPIVLRAVGSDSMTLTIAGQVERLRVDRDGHILGGSIPAQGLTITRVDAAAASHLELGRIDYSPPAGAPYTAVDVTVPGPGGITLGGTLTLPAGKGPFPAVVTITGSGSQDRDEYIPLAGGYRPFRQIADTLARRGIAVLRVDDRGVGESSGGPGTSADYAQDVEAELRFLAARPDIDARHLALLGHSEGGLIAPMVAVQDTLVKAIVLLAGPAETGAEIIRYQQHQAIDGDATILPSSRDSAYRAAQVALDSLARTSPWVRYFLSYDPIPTAMKVRVPALILEGANDHQVTPVQAEMLARAMRSGGDRDVTEHLFPGLDHLFLPDASGLPSEYGKLRDNHLPANVLGTIADWVAEKLGAR
jgi:uncharacterized protein